MGGQGREKKGKSFFIHLTYVVLKSCSGRRTVGGGRSRGGDRLELMVLMLTLNVAIWSEVVRQGTAFSKVHCDPLLYLEKR